MTERQTLAQVMREIEKKHPGVLIKGAELKDRVIPRITTGSLSLDVMLGGGWPVNQFNEIVGEFCLSPDTRVLTTDLEHRRLGDMAVGDQIIGFDEELNQGRGKSAKFRRARIESLGRALLPTYEITTQHGVTTASHDHMWVVTRRSSREWVRTADLQEGDRIASVGPVWEADVSYEAGWLAGFYDGEGWLSGGNGGGGNYRLGNAQNEGPTCEHAIALCEKLGFGVNIKRDSHPSNDKRVAWSFEGRYEDMRFLGTVRPQRLLAKSHLLWEGVSTKSVHNNYAVVKKVRHLGQREVVTIGTTTKTLIADGMLSHNSSGKTSVVYKTIAANQALNPEFSVVWVASEPFVADWAEAAGCDLERFIIIDNNVIEEAFTMLLEFVANRLCDCVVIDSLPAMIPGTEDEKGMEEWQVGLAARLNNKFFRKATASVRRSMVEEDRPCTFLIINQFREKIGVMHGDSRTTPGGKGKDFAYFTKVEVRRKEWIEHNKERVGIRIAAKTSKNKSAPPMRGAEVNFYFADAPGFRAGEYDVADDLVGTAVYTDVISRPGGGNTYYFGDKKLGVGLPKTLEMVREDLGLQNEIRERTLQVTSTSYAPDIPTEVLDPKPKPKKKLAR